MNQKRSPHLSIDHFKGRERIYIYRDHGVYRLSLRALLYCLLFIGLLSPQIIEAQPVDSPSDSTAKGSKGLSEEGANSTQKSELRSIKITLYPQHDVVELINSDQIMVSWPLFYGYVLDHMPASLSKETLDHFLQWKSSQSLFVSLKDLEMLKTSLSDHLMIVEQASELEVNHLFQQDKLQKVLERLKLQKNNLEREEAWLEQQKVLKAKQAALEELKDSESSLRESIDKLLKRFKEKIEREKVLQQEALGEDKLEGDKLEGDKLELEELETALGALTLFHRSLRSREQILKRCIKSLERLLFASAELVRNIPQMMEVNQDRLRTLALWRSYWMTRDQVEKRYEESSEESLLSQVSGQQAVIEARWRGLKELGAELKEKQQSFKVTYIDSLRGSGPPEITEVIGDRAYEKVKVAYDNATLFLNFHTARRDQLNEMISKGKLLLSEVGSFSKKLLLSWEDIIEVDVLSLTLRRAKELNFEHINLNSIIERSSERDSEKRNYQLITLREEWERYSDRLNSMLSAWRKALDDDKAAILRIHQEVFGEGGLKDRLNLERAWLEFVEEIKGLDGPSLLAKHSEALSLYVVQETKINGLSRDYDQVNTSYQEGWRALRELSDPLLRQYKDDSSGFKTQIKELESLIKEVPTEEGDGEGWERGPELEAETAKDDQEEDQSGNAIKSQRNQSTHQREYEAIKDEGRESTERVSHREKIIRVSELTRQLRDQLSPQIAHYRQFKHKVDELESLWKQREALILSLQGEYARRVEFARQVRRTASVIRFRILDQELPMEAMTDEIENHGQREWVEQLRAESLDDLKSQLAYDRHLIELEPAYAMLIQVIERLRTLLGEVLDLSSRQLRSINEALAEESSSESLQRRDQGGGERQDKVFELKTLGERQFEHELQLRMDEDFPWYDSLWSSFSNEYVDNIEALLKDHYVELIKTEKAQQHIEERIKLTRDLAEAIAAQRPLLESYQEELTRVIKRMNSRFTTYRAEVELRLDPQMSTKQLRIEDRSSALHLDLLMSAPIKGREEYRQVLGELEQQWAIHRAYEAACKDLHDRLGPQGTLEELSGEVRDAISQLETERDELNRPLKRLLGKRARGVDLTQELPFIGEIDRLHQERIRIKLRVLLLSLLSFLLIPLLTFVSLRTIGSIERRIRRLSERELERLVAEGDVLSRQKRSEREDRLATLLQVMRTTSKLLIFTIATGAMLKTLHVDVTPIIASAGIIGLAFAFGAQELVKDFFAGIFILFENQYNRGDFVTINGIFGWIDKITLRITVIRDSHGVIHFIPNGQVLLVSNHNKEWSQAHLEIGASYNNPPKQVIDCLRQLCNEISVDPVIGEDVLGWEVLGLERFDDSAVVYRVHLKTAPKEKWRVARHYRKRVMEVFADEGIEIPFPQLVVTRSSTSALESEQP